MGEIKLLDCTLRDGGYVNDWKFGHNNIVSIFERLVDSNVDYIEVGFLDDRRPFDMDRSIMPDTESVKKIYGKLDRKQACVVGMIDYGTCTLNNIQDCKDSYLDAIRVIFKKHLRKEALEYCGKLKEKGYKLVLATISPKTTLDIYNYKNKNLYSKFKLYDVFDLVLSHDDVEKKKPDPEVYLTAVKMINTPKNECLAIEDSLEGVKAANNAGIEVINIVDKNMFNTQKQIDELSTYKMNSLQEFYEFLKTQ